jgi:hypothetical protein
MDVVQFADRSSRAFVSAPVERIRYRSPCMNLVHFRKEKDSFPSKLFRPNKSHATEFRLG